jgi:hypothetical protein
MRAFMRFTRWFFLITAVLVALDMFHVYVPGLGLFMLISYILVIPAFLFMCVVNFIGFFILSDRKDRSRLYSSKQYRVKLEN